LASDNASLVLKTQTLPVNCNIFICTVRLTEPKNARPWRIEKPERFDRRV
jgi:hypothetical protein